MIDYWDREDREEEFQRKREQIERFLPPEAESERLERGNTILLEITSNDTVPAIQAEVSGLHGLPFARDTVEGSPLQRHDTV